MSETMLKRMAQAIRNHAPLLNEILAEELALAALRAMREPTEAMWLAMDPLCEPEWFKSDWGKAIDAAIHEAENAK